MRKLLLFMCMCLSLTFAWAQNRTVSGKVTDQKGNAVPNASIQFKGTNRGMTTDENGSFSILVPNGVKALVVSSIGFTTQEVTLGSSSTLAVTLLPGSGDNLSEVVVVAYGVQRKGNLTGSVATIKGADIENKPFSSVDKALQGAVAGLQSASTSGAPGSATNIRIRGIGSINASAEPLWVIDGVIANTGDLSSNTTTANALSGLNPDDIDNISVLKDAAATSIYGSRAANGIILVTTKKGKGGKTKLNFSTEIGKNSLAYKNNNNKALTTAQSQTLFREAVINGGYATTNEEADAFITDPNGLGLPSNYTATNTNWLDVVTQTGNQAQYNLSLSGGNDKTQFYTSAGYFKQEGTTIASDFKRYNGSFSLTHKASDKITFTTGLNGSSSVQNTPANGGAFANPILSSFFLVPWYSPYNADGSLKYDDSTGQFPVNGGLFNPVVQAAFNKGTLKQTQLRGYVTGEYQILKNLKFTSRFSAEYLVAQEDAYRNPFYGDGQAQGGDGFASNRRVFDWTWSNLAEYRINLNQSEDFYVNILGGYEAQYNNNYLLQAGGQAFPGNLSLQYLASAATPTTAYSLPSENSTISYLSNAVINYKDRYVITGSFRRDGSSVFGVNRRYGNFYSVGGSWNINEESFFEKAHFLNLLKLRSSYGENGNSTGFGNYLSLATYGYGYNYTGLPGSAPNNVGNSDLTWEKNKIFNIGLDFALWKNRFYGTVEYYKRVTSDLLINVPLSPTSGFSGGQLLNVGSMYNQGYELTLGGKPVVTKDFTWDVNFNISHNKNRVTKLYNKAPVPYNSFFLITEGHDIQEFYRRQWAGVDPTNGDPLWYTDGTHKATTNNVSNAAPSLSNKSASPKYYGSLTNTFSYKGFSLSGQLFYNFGNYLYDSWDSYQNSDGVYYGSFNQVTSQLNSWKKPGDITNVPKVILGGNKNSYVGSTRYLYKGDYIRLRDVQLSYAIPQAFIKRAHLSNITVYVRGTNLLTFGTDKNLPLDPEAGILSTNNFDVFIAKTITGGIKIGL